MFERTEDLMHITSHGLNDIPDLAHKIKEIHDLRSEARDQIKRWTDIKNDTLRYSNHFDFGIGLGAVGSGVSGLGILSNEKFALLCAVITTVAFVLSIAKAAYKWSDRVSTSSQIIAFYEKITYQCKALTMDATAKQKVDSEMMSKCIELTQKMAERPDYPYPIPKKYRF